VPAENRHEHCITILAAVSAFSDCFIAEGETVVKRLIVLQEKCVDCGACALACSKRHFGESNKEKANIHPRGKKGRLRVCVQCTKRICLESCLKKAIQVDGETGALRVDSQKCDGCGKCVLACPNQAPWIDKAMRKMRVCDLCNGETVCVSTCRFDAIRYMELNDFVCQTRKTMVRQRR
jgi:Fe-S-cluster-containing dehydrogenase component